MLIFLSACVGIAGIAYLVAVAKEWTWWKYLLKPGTMLMIMGIVGVSLERGDSYGWLILLGLVFSMIGDIFLMLPSDRFVPGLISFFCAHVVYIFAFPGNHSFSLRSFIVALFLFLISLIYFLFVQSGVRRQGGTRLLMAVALYMTIISWMVWKALLSGQWLLVVGSLSFYLSDAILGWDRFVRKLNWGTYGVMITYYLAQYLIALSAGLG
ncbi:lysoplasmalogenase [Thermoflavimicrobium dichotomicum]|uniref:Uncharacterized membrane protein YhhN n=1 Tax=Thermoflavimicrobium dichotomicum TaxID=46223 RepID=A0A1I3MGY3_9BACL|nr:lysoplasmalogenase [Thermoflavimicrobium dichotomicum]SFI96268.1 Uncharacterized membrane protein YhhN [Thermoflavimicrobium dichotomicum]